MKTGSITDLLRKQIVGGEYPCGCALPARYVLLEKYGVSVATFQKSINALIREGFLESRGGSGVFVRKDLPSQYHLGLILPADSAAELSCDSLWEALFREGKNFCFEGEKVTLIPYFLGGNEVGESAEMQRLCGDIAHGRLCGAIRFRNWPEGPLPSDFPCINMDYEPGMTPPFRIRMNTDHSALFAQSLLKLKESGIRRAAVIYHVQLNSRILLQCRELAKKSGMKILPEWFLPFHIGSLNSVAYHWQIGGLFSKNRKECPEALIVMNENLLPVVLTSLNELEMIPGRDVKIVSHVNQYQGKKLEHSVQYVGFRAADILDSSMKSIRAWPRTPERAITIPPVEFVS